MKPQAHTFQNRGGGLITGNLTATGTISATKFVGEFEGTIGSATNADSAEKDANGNIIASTYATKNELTSGLGGKSDTGHVHSYNDLTNKPTIPTAVTESTVSGWGFTKNAGTVTGIKINGTSKAPSNGIIDLGNIITSQIDISSKLDKTEASTTYATKTDLSNGLSGKSDTGHTHDDRYYTESEVNTKLAAKSDTTHTHSYNDLTNKPTIPAAVTDSTVSGWGFTKNAGTVTGIKINGSTKSPSSGVVDLGTIITAHQDISGKVDKVSGKGLSTNDYTTAEKNKLAGIASGAEVNQNAFANIVVGSTTIAADTKTDSLTIVAGSNVNITPDATNDKITIAAVDTTYGAATQSANGLMSASDKKKLDGIASGANVNTLTGVKGNAETSYRTGQVNITAANIGLGNVNNTADSAKTVKHASTSDSSIKATQDGSGNVITSTYATKTDLSNGLSSHTHTSGQVSGLATVATSGKYSDLSGLPTIPSNTNQLTNGAGFVTSSGVTNVVAGSGLTGGGSSATSTLNVGAGTGISVAADAVSVVYGTTAGTACQGNDSRLSNSRPASDVYAWAKASTKPSYTASEVGAVPTGRTVNGKALSSNISLTYSDVGTAQSSHTHDDRYFTESEINTKLAGAITGGKPLQTFNTTSIAMSPNTYYRLTSAQSSLTITLNTPSNANILNEYFIEFPCGGSVTLPSSILWANGEAPSFESGKTYQISIVNNLGICVVFG